MPNTTTFRQTPARVLLTSAGSLLGRGILSTLAGRRQHLVLVDGDLNPHNPGTRSCDVAVSLPPTHTPSFTEAVARTVAEHHIDLVIPGRDPDALLLAHTNLPLAASNPQLVEISRDKLLTYQWCQGVGIPFVATACTDHADGPQALEWPLPLIAKPRAGSGSIGVRVLHTPAQVAATLAQPGMVIQPFLDPPPQLSPDLTLGTPLFWEVECNAEYGVQALIGPHGEVGPWFCFVASHKSGRNDSLRPCHDASLQAFASTVVPQLAAHGWRGPINLQARRSAQGWQLIEINPRFSGGTSGRYLLGFDEVGWVLNTWLGAGTVPPGPAVLAQEVVWLPQEFALGQSATTATPLFV
ncbi:MAG: ATP-grasp domain-containing protein [Burkholderiaceae bacterium]|nr:ATP-grasp domain-containing protein [Burkholderiaceae bacterium]MDP3134320.1 ATP-grasp domain-containing protein [Burkholderiaceae bacterium]MDZ4161169.1 ATP-grasp domain-containing protein [Burkholderiales bacterium]